MRKYAQCKGCNATIIWVRMPSGKLMPVDAEPTFLGTVAIHSDGIRGAVLRREEREKLPAGTKLYLPHHVTCPNADEFRKES